MEYDIKAKEFWDRMILKVNDFYNFSVYHNHIANMPELTRYMGLKYLETYLDGNNVNCFKFKVLNKKKFFLIKIKYGI